MERGETGGKDSVAVVALQFPGFILGESVYVSK